jgi:ribose transport system ATP-binding protein
MPPTAAPAALTLEGLTKVFEGQRALDCVDLELRRGEVHALVGQNGSGKSTLIKILAGYHAPEPGAVAEVGGEPFELGSARAAQETGIRFIHQDLGLIGGLDAVDNFALVGGYRRRWWLSDRSERAAIRDVLAEYDLDFDVSAPIGTLSPTRQAMLAIVRALHGTTGGLVVLDEPTASLPAQEIRQLFSLIRDLRARGAAVLVVTHRLGEVFEIADRVTVLRDGRRVATRPVAELDHDRLVELIVGRPLEAFYAPPPEPRDDVILEVEDLAGAGVAGVSFTVHEGEIVGVTGLTGSGHEDLVYLLFGARPRTSGAVVVDGEPLDDPSPAAAIRAGMAFAPADRRRLSATPVLSLRENLTLPDLRPIGPARWLSPRSERSDTLRWLDRLGVVPPDPERIFATLSGGNQQRVVLGRWLRCGSRVLLFEEPTNGVDTAAKQGIYAALSEAAASGAATLISSADPEELSAICDRVIVMRGGVIGTTLAGAALDPDAIVAQSLLPAPTAAAEVAHA